MKRPSVTSVILLTIHGFALVLFLWGVYSCVIDVPENKCSMTYMFEHPQYIKIPLSLELQERFPKYNLFVYGEGVYAEKLRQRKFLGIPALFVPGNAGSYRQVRSLASVALRKQHEQHYPFHLNFFTVDFGEELSAFYGGYLDGQAEFVAECIKAVLQLYGAKTEPRDDRRDRMMPEKSVVLIGHSIGGMIAKNVFTFPWFNELWVHTLVTLATPHRPILQVDPHLSAFYKMTDRYWLYERREYDGNVSHVTTVSVGGGARDLLVPTSYAYDKFAKVNALTTTVPNVWRSTDHLCILWCKEFVLVTVRMLFDIIERTGRSSYKRRGNLEETGAGIVATSEHYRLDVARYHMSSRYGDKELHPELARPNSRYGYGDDMLACVFLNETQQTVMLNSSKMARHVVVPLQQSRDTALAVVIVDGEDHDWIHTCRRDENYKSRDSSLGSKCCRKLRNRSDGARILPSAQKKRRIAFIPNLKDIEHTDEHILIEVGPYSKPVQVSVDQFSENERFVNISVPSPGMALISTPLLLLTERDTSEGALHFTFRLKNFISPLQAYRLVISKKSCNMKHVNSKDISHAVAFLHVPWSTGNEQHVILSEALKEEGTVEMPVKLGMARPTAYMPDNHAELRLWLDPKCTYNVILRPSLRDTMEQAVRFYMYSLPAYVVAIALIAVSMQMSSIGSDTGECVSFHKAMLKVTPLALILPVLLCSPLLNSLLKSSPQLRPVFETDVKTEADLGHEGLPATILRYVVGWSVTFVVGVVGWALVLTAGNAAHSVLLKLLARRIPFSDRLVEFVVRQLFRFPLALAVALIAVSIQTCGAFGLALGMVLYFIKLVRLYENYLETLFGFSSVGDMLKKAFRFLYRCLKLAKVTTKPDEPKTSGSDVHRRSESEDLSALHFHFGVATLWFYCLVINVPSLVIWGTKLNQATFLSPDPSLPSALVLCGSVAILWRKSTPQALLPGTFILSKFLNILAVGAVMYGSVTFHLLSFFIMAAVSIIAIQQGLARRPDETTKTDDPLPPPDSEEEETEKADSEGGGDGAAVDQTN